MVNLTTTATTGATVGVDSTVYIGANHTNTACEYVGVYGAVDGQTYDLGNNSMMGGWFEITLPTGDKESQWNWGLNVKVNASANTATTTGSAYCLYGMYIDMNMGTGTWDREDAIRIWQHGTTALDNVIIFEGTAAVGIDLGDGCTTGIDIGTATTGITLTGTTYTHAILVGSYGNEIVCTSDKHYPVGIFGKVSTSETTSKEIRSLLAYMTIDANVDIGNPPHWGTGIQAIEGTLIVKGGATTTDLNPWKSCGIWGMIEDDDTLANKIDIPDGSIASALFGQADMGAGCTISAGGVLAAVCAYSSSETTLGHTGDYVGVYVDYDGGEGKEPFKTGIKIEDSASTTGIDIGTTATGIIISGDCTNAAIQTGVDYDNPLTLDGTPSKLALFNGVVATKGCGFVRAVEARVIVTATGTYDATDSYYGIRGNLKFSPGSATTYSENVGAGVLGLLDINDADITISGANVKFAGVNAAVGGSAVATLTAGYVSGVYITSNLASTLDTSAAGFHYNAIMITRGDANQEPWNRGIEIASGSCLQGFYIAIAESSANTTYHNDIEISEVGGTATEHQGLRVNYETDADTDAATSYRIAIAPRMRIGGDTTWNANIWCSMGITSDTSPTIDTLTGLYVYGNALGTASVNEYFAINLNMDCTNAATEDGFIRCYGHGGTPQSVIYLPDNSGTTHLLKMQGVAPWDGEAHGATAGGRIKIKVGTGTKYLHVWND